MRLANPRAFAVLVSVLIGAEVLAIVFMGAWAGVETPKLLVIFLTAALFEVAPITVNRDVTATMSVVVVFVAIALAGVPGAAVAGLAVGLASYFSIETHRILKTGLNIGMHVAAASTAAIVFAAIVSVDAWAPVSGAPLHSPLVMTSGLVVAGLVYSMINAAVLAVGVHLAAGVPVVASAVDMFAQVALMQFLHVGLSAIAYTLLIRVGAESLIFIMVPLLLARRSLLTVQQRQEAFDRMVRTFVKAIELKDGYTRGHAERVSDLSVLVAERMGLSYEERQLIRYGAILHDVGKIGVSLGILCKAGPLTDVEYDEMKLHPEIGSEMLADIDFLQPALSIVHHHHERIDGDGYPAGLTGDAIPLLTRVVTAVDAFDAMTSTRSYRRALPVPVAIGELQANAGSQFDREVVEHLVAVIDEEGWTVTDEPVAVASLHGGEAT